MASEEEVSERAGFLAVLSAFTIWGLAPLFWRSLRHLDTTEILAHRVFWSAVFAFVLLVWTDPTLAPLRRLRETRLRRTMLLSTALIAVNWFVFVWGVNNGRVTEVSLGYYANPLLNILLGRLVLGERLNGLQAAAVALAAAAVAYLTWKLGAFPWVSAAVALSFSLYGLIRKQASMPGLAGFAIETGLCAPLCILYAGVGLTPSFGALQTGGAWDVGLLVFSGVMTATPLILFAIGSRRLRYSTVGMIQYVAPTLQLACAVLVFGEAFTSAHALTFTCIWSAIALYAVGQRQHRT